MQDYAFSLEEIDREVVELLPDREELVLNFVGTAIGASQAGVVPIAVANVGALFVA